MEAGILLRGDWRETPRYPAIPTPIAGSSLRTWRIAMHRRTVRQGLTRVDGPQRDVLRLRQALVRLRSFAEQHRRIEVAAPWIVDHPVLDAIDAVAGRQRRRLDGR